MSSCNSAAVRTGRPKLKLRSFAKGFRQHRPHRLAISVLRRGVELGYVDIAGVLAEPTLKGQAFCATAPTIKLIDARKPSAT
jgi:hypothetical protein